MLPGRAAARSAPDGTSAAVSAVLTPDRRGWRARLRDGGPGLCVVLTLSAACAPRAPVLPSGPGAPFAEYAAAYADATETCRGITTITLSMSLSGKAGSTRLRGRIDAGFAAPARARLEGIPPFGKPVFVLVADGPRATLVLTRDDRVLRDAPPDRIVEALAGVALGPDALRAIVSGCGFEHGRPSDGKALGNGWSAVRAGESTTYLQRGGDGWRVAAATRGPLTVFYGDYANRRPTVIRLRSVPAGGPAADLTLRLSDVETNTTLDPKTFDVDLPARPLPLTLEELRRAGPLGGS